MKKIKHVAFFPNGNQMVFDENGEQIGELQESWLLLWAKHATELGYDVTNIDGLTLPNQQPAKILKTENGFNWQIGNA